MTYEGWANYQTWNVSLWINNEESIYRQACDYVARTEEPTYEGFIRVLDGVYGDVTPDGVSWTDPTLDMDELDEMIRELEA